MKVRWYPGVLIRWTLGSSFNKSPKDLQFNSVQFNSIQFDQFNSIQFNSIQFNSIQFDSHFRWKRWYLIRWKQWAMLQPPWGKELRSLSEVIPKKQGRCPTQSVKWSMWRISWRWVRFLRFLKKIHTFICSFVCLFNYYFINLSRS